MATAQELLTAVESAIETILNGGAVQSYSINGRNLQRMSIQELRALRGELKKEVAISRKSENSSTNFPRFNRPA